MMKIKIYRVTREFFIKSKKCYCMNDYRLDENNIKYWDNNDKCKCGGFMGECENKCVGNTIIKCLKCKKNTTFGCSFDIGSGKLISYFCNTCNIYYNMCNGCYNNGEYYLCKLIEHHNYNNVTKIPTSICDIIERYDPYDDNSKTIIKYSKPVYFFDESIFGYFTGPDGGYTSIWKCDNCNNTSIFEDK